MFHARDKNSLDIGLGGPKDHVVSFVLNSEAFVPKTAPPTVTKNAHLSLINTYLLTFISEIL